jgi:hypothetical protein
MNTLTLVAYTAILLAVFTSVYAQEKSTDDEMKAVLAQDSILWMHYNACEMEKMREVFGADIEFYHDKGGVLKGLDNLISTSQKNLCTNENFRLRREAVAGTVKAFPMKNEGIVYGAILTGEHVFYVLEKGKEPRPDGLAKFTHLFLKSDGVWKISRVFSYDHGPSPYVNHRKQITLSEHALRKLGGAYEAPKTGLCVVKPEDDFLNLVIGDQVYKLLPETETSFFVIGRDLTFEFIHDKASKRDKMIVRENGNVVEEALRKN